MSRRSMAAVCLIVGLGLTVGLAACAPRKPGPRFAQGIQLPREHGPFLAGIPTDTMPEAEALFGRHIVRPSHSQASDSTIRQVFFERIPGDPDDSPAPLADTVHVAIDYDSGVLIIIELEAGTQSRFDTDPGYQYRLMVADEPGARTTTVNGSPAMTMPRKESEPAVVDVTMRGERVVIYSDYSNLDVGDLLDMAQTLS